MEKQKLAELTLAGVVLIFGVLIAINLANIDETNATMFTSMMFSRRQVSAPLLRIVDEVREGVYSKSDVEYPQFVRGPIELNSDIKNIVDAAVTQHEQTAQNNWSSRMSALSPDTAVVPTDKNKLLIRIRWQPAEISTERISFLLRIFEVTGGVHDIEEVRTFNYDLRGRRLLKLTDMFPGNPNYLDQLSGFSYDSLKQQLTQKFNTKLGDASLKWLKAGTAPDVHNFQEFTIDHGVLTLYFSQYQVAAYEHGVPEVTYAL